MADWLRGIGFILVLGGFFLLPVWIAIYESNRQIKECKAVYSGAALERCIHRTSKGGPVYEENIGKLQ